MSPEPLRAVTLPLGPFTPDTDYVVLNADGTPSGSGLAVPMGGGGASVVYRVVYKKRLARAVKVLSPRQELLDRQPLEAFKATFEHEIAILASLTHTRVAKILDFGTAQESDGSALLYYAMDLIDGVHLDEAFTDVSAAQFLVLFDQILDGVEYLHAQGVLHGDLKEENILVRREGDTFSAAVVDLGVAKTIKPEMPVPPAPSEAQMEIDLPRIDEDITLFFSTRKLMRPEWEERLNRQVSRRELREMFPDHDLYSLGRLISLALNPERPLRPRLEAHLGDGGVRALQAIQDRLAHSPRGQYESVKALRRDWKKLDPRYLAPLAIPELAVGASASVQIATPSGRVSLTNRAAEIVNHPHVQRLRNIPQLELMSLVYPGASHTRLLHSLSTFDMARRFVMHLLRDPVFRLSVEPFEIEAVLVAALLHDVGHFPLSHMFEDLAAEERASGALHRTIPTDEDLFPVFLDPGAYKGDFSGFANVLLDDIAKRCPSGSLADVIRHQRSYGGEILDAIASFAQPMQESRAILAGLLSSAVDVDKVAYLGDDSAMTGVRFGLGLDLDGLLAALIAPTDGDYNPELPIFALKDKGLPAAEGVVLARYWMLKRVYWHHTSRAMIAMVKYVIRALLREEYLDVEEYFAQTLRGSAADGLCYLSDLYDEAMTRRGDSARGAVNPLNGLRGAERVIYKRLVTVGFGPGKGEERLHDGLMRKPEVQLDQIVGRAEVIIERYLPAGKGLREGEVLIDRPSKDRQEHGAPVLIYLERGDRRGQPLEEISPVVAALRAEFAEHVKKVRIFVAPRVREEFGSKEGDVREDLREMLRSECGLT